MAHRSKFYESSSSASSSESDALPETRSQAKKTIGFYVLQARSNMHAQDYAKVFKAISMIAQKCQTASNVGTDLRIACLRVCHQVEMFLGDDTFPQDRHARRRVLSASQAKASLSLQQKHVEILAIIRTRFNCIVPREVYTESAKPTLDALEKHLIVNRLSPIPLELLNTFELVSE